MHKAIHTLVSGLVGATLASCTSMSSYSSPPPSVTTAAL